LGDVSLLMVKPLHAIFVLAVQPKGAFVFPN